MTDSMNLRTTKRNLRIPFVLELFKKIMANEKLMSVFRLHLFIILLKVFHPLNEAQ
jgi:hypothetical protein